MSEFETKQHIFLIPGFLGIESLGEVLYFAHVRDVLVPELERLGVRAEVHAVDTYATSSMRKRTQRLAKTIAQLADPDAALHLIGHSTGGLDARLLCTPGASLGGGMSRAEIVAIASRVRSIVAIATPHQGTPLASYFTTRFGAQLLGALSLATSYVLRYGRLPLSLAIKFGTLFVQLQSRIGWVENTVAEQLLHQILGDFDAARRDELLSLMKDMADDQSLMPQLMPESMDVFETAVGPRPDMRCASVVALAERSTLRGIAKLGFDPYAQATHLLFDFLRRLTTDMPASYMSELSPEQERCLIDAFGRVPDHHDNDGIVPSRSQVWGELIHAVRADHFDVIGHFGEPKSMPPHFDWLASGSGFDLDRFHALWHSVAAFIADESRAS